MGESGKSLIRCSQDIFIGYLNNQRYSMGTYIDDLKKALGRLEGNVKADLEEIRRQKNEIQSLKDQIYKAVTTGRYIRDENRLVLSAPEIVIGNVDHDGVLLGEGGSTVIIRGNEVNIEAAGSSMTGGSVVTRAASIRQIGVDPGKDGTENVLCDGRSEVVSIARSIALRTEDSKGCLARQAVGASSGISLSSDNFISISAAPSNKSRKSEVENSIKELDKESKYYESSAGKVKKSIDSILSDLSDCMKSQGKLSGSAEDLITNDFDLSVLEAQFGRLQQALTVSLSEYVRLQALRMEAVRKSDALKKMNDELGKKSADFSKKTNGAVVSIASEMLTYMSIDGDGNIRENPEAGIYALTPHVDIVATDKTGALMKDGSMSVNVMKFDLSTASAKLDEKGEKGDFTAMGDVTVTSKNITVQTVDKELKDKKIQEKALTKDGTFRVRAEKISAEATDTEGKSTGEIKLNAKSIRAASMDVDKEKRTDKEMAAGSTMVLLSEKVYAGAMDKKKKSKLVQVASEKVGLMADTTAEMQQGEGKAVITLDGGNLSAGGGKNEFNGDTTIAGKADIKGDTTAPKGSFKNLEAGSSFKSSNISDGIPVPAPAAPGKPSAKMKMEEVASKQ